MSASYVPEKVNAVCTYQCSSDPSQFIASREVRTVDYKDKNIGKVLLNKNDKNTIKQFTCKADQHSFWSILALGAGLIVGALLLLSGPIGWAVLAVGACIMAAATISYLTANHNCTEPMEAGKWALFHPSVKFDKALALTHNSVLKCEKGGLLTPIFDSQVAKQTAADIANNNRWEVGIDAGIAFVSGVGFAAAGGEILGAMAGASTLGAAVTAGGVGLGRLGFYLTAGTVATLAATDAERYGIRNLTDTGSEQYKTLNEVDEMELMPEFVADPNKTNGDDIANLNDLLTINPKGTVMGIKDSYQENQLSKQLSSDLKDLLKTAESHSEDGKVNVRTLFKEPKAQQIVADIRAGKYPDKMVKAAIDGNDKVRPKKVLDMAKDVAETTKDSSHEMRMKSTEGAANVAALLPLVTTWLSENGRKDLADAMEKDSKNGINVLAATQ